jgi:hypothetical protein
VQQKIKHLARRPKPASNAGHSKNYRALIHLKAVDHLLPIHKVGFSSLFNSEDVLVKIQVVPVVTHCWRVPASCICAWRACIVRVPLVIRQLNTCAVALPLKSAPLREPLACQFVCALSDSLFARYPTR